MSTLSLALCSNQQRSSAESGCYWKTHCAGLFLTSSVTWASLHNPGDFKRPLYIFTLWIFTLSVPMHARAWVLHNSCACPSPTVDAEKAQVLLVGSWCWMETPLLRQQRAQMALGQGLCTWRQQWVQDMLPSVLSLWWAARRDHMEGAAKRGRGSKGCKWV